MKNAFSRLDEDLDNLIASHGSKGEDYDYEIEEVVDLFKQYFKDNPKDLGEEV